MSDTPTSGSIKIASDESFLPLINAESDAFESLYPKTKIEVEYQPQDKAVMDLLNNKADMIFIGRELNQGEKEFIRNKKISVVTNKIAIDAIALLINDELALTQITTTQLKDIFKGKIKMWNEISTTLPDESIEIVTDKSTSSNLNYLRQKMDLDIEVVKIVAAGSNSNVLQYIKNNKRAIGIIGANWISDEDDSSLKSRLQDITVLAVSEEGREEFYQPLQAFIADNRYPLTRSLFMVSKSVKVGLVSGFSSFILSDPGQRIVLKEGLLPAIMPGREIVITKK